MTVDGQIETPKVGHTLTIDPSLVTTSGLISSDETWSGTVNITGDVTVLTGVVPDLDDIIIQLPAEDRASTIIG